jgi:hypothetical protein
MKDGRRLQATLAQLSESYTIVLLALPHPSAGTAFTLATGWRCYSRTNMIILSCYTLVLGWE